MTFENSKFPNSKIDPFLLTSPQTPIYNCIAWAFGSVDKWFWPDVAGTYFWPSDIPRTETLDSFIKLFEIIGYKVCDNGDLEKDYQKIAIYADGNGKPTHAARQLRNGFWTSKLGQSFDVTHTIHSMSDGLYGNVAAFMKRQENQTT
ncbi:MAG: hypothetical protein BroJett042_23050 [Bacteroidota bacterium]|nr:MAG: hypothetical protein HWD62_10210 [Cyclobacteriaceae bacterium]GIL23792.1 MAG: hypothetical protein BroJett042_23050 [Bacteroidota bacterium]